MSKRWRRTISIGADETVSQYVFMFSSALFFGKIRILNITSKKLHKTVLMVINSAESDGKNKTAASARIKNARETKTYFLPKN
jgi:hypothetical protein